MIRIINLRNYTLKPTEILIKCDRSSPVGNPFPVTPTRTHKQACLEFYKHVLNHNYNASFVEYVQHLKQLSLTKDIAIGCWCTPKCCHTELIRRIITGERTSLTAMQEYLNNYNEDGTNK